jgi:hypothetical protein
MKSDCHIYGSLHRAAEKAGVKPGDWLAQAQEGTL